MKATNLSLILLSTLSCDADCDYCFETKTADSLTHEGLAQLIDKVLSHMDRQEIQTLMIYWQGGEVMTLPPSWYEQAGDIIQHAAGRHHKQVINYLQSNMMSYHAGWNRVIKEMFDNSVGSSLDFPNRHRRLVGGSPQDYNALWFRNVQQARQAGIEVAVISIPNQATLEMGAEQFYAYFVEELGLTSFQINTPFPGGRLSQAKKSFPLDNPQLSRFLLELVEVWVARGYHQGISLGPFDELIQYFWEGNAVLPCIWRDSCVNEFFCIDPRGYVSQCDCWVASYPEFRFGNIFVSDSLTELLANSAARRRLQARPGLLIQREDCLECNYLALCHGGCPIRAYSTTGNLQALDPYCPTYKSLFAHLEQVAVRLAQSRRSPLQSGSG
jgi:radical SAM protein with 4Fe4S-binding SPASM domain